MFRRKFPAPFHVEPRHIDFANIQQRTQRQCDHAPTRMLCQPRQRDPIVPVAKLTTRWSRRRIMMHAGSFDVPPVTLLRSVVDGQRDPPTRPRIELLDHKPQHDLRHLPRLPTNADERVVKPIPIIEHSRRDEPRTGRPPSVREQHPRHDDRQPKTHPQIEHSGHPRNRRRQPTDQRKLGPRSVLPLRIRSFQPPPFVMLRGLRLLMLPLWSRRRFLTLSHPWLS